MKKLLALILALTFCLSIVGCGSDNNNKTTTNTDIEEESYTLVETGVLTMGTNAAFPPYEFIGADGSVTGIDAEIAKAVADKLGMELEIKDMDFDSLITAVKTGSIDVCLAGMTVTEERKNSVSFSNTYATGIQVIIVKDGSPIKSVDDLAGKTIGVQTGTTGDIYCTDDYGQEYVKQFNNGPLAVTALKNGQVDCVIIDNEPAKTFVANNKGLKILETEYVTEDYAAAINKNNTKLLNDFNKALDELKADGTIDKIINKYISAE